MRVFGVRLLLLVSFVVAVAGLVAGYIVVGFGGLFIFALGAAAALEEILS